MYTYTVDQIKPVCSMYSEYSVYMEKSVQKTRMVPRWNITCLNSKCLYSTSVHKTSFDSTNEHKPV